MILFLTAMAGGCGAICRYLLDSWIQMRWRPRTPAGTMVINVSGSFLLGFISALTAAHDPSWLLAVLGVGFCGGYTTFSTASVEVVTMARGGARGQAAAHAILMLVLSITGAAAGVGLALGLNHAF